MRIFYFSRIDIGVNDASTRHVFETCKQFVSMGHETLLFVPNMGSNRQLPGVSIIQVPVLIRKSAFTYFSFHAFLFLYLLFHCLKNKPDAVYTRQQTSDRNLFRFQHSMIHVISFMSRLYPAGCLEEVFVKVLYAVIFDFIKIIGCFKYRRM